MRLDLNFTLKDLDGNDIPDSNVGKIVARTLFFSAEKQNDIKFHDWAIALHKGEAITLDTQDEATLKEAIEKMNLPVVTSVAIKNAFKKGSETTIHRAA